MSDRVLSAEEKAAAERRGPAIQRRPGGGPPHAGLGMPAEKAENFRGTAVRLLKLLSPDRAAVVLVLALAAAAVAMQAYGPRVLGFATDIIFGGVIGARFPDGTSQEFAADALRGQGQDKLADLVAALPTFTQGIDFAALSQVLAFAAGLYVVASILIWLQGRVIVGAVNRAVFRLRSDVEDKLHRLPLPYIDKQPRGELLSRVTNDIDNVAQSLQQTLTQMMTSLLTVLFMLAMMFWVSPLLALIALVTIPVSIGLTAVIGKRSQKLFKQQWKSTGELNATIEESFTGHQLVKVYGRSGAVSADFAETNGELRRATFGAQFMSGLIMPTMQFVGNLNYVAVAVVGGLRVASGSLSLGDVQAFIQYSRQFTMPLTQVASMANLLQSGVASAERVFELLDAEEESPEPVAVDLEATRGAVEFQDVAFSYVPEQPLIEGLSLSVQPGQMVAIVGPTGAGKTTLVNLIMRFYELNGGRILLDGIDVATMTRAQLRSQVGMVLQDTWLFEGTIADNIGYGRPDATREEIVAAAQACYVDRFVHSLPEGYDTKLDSDASNLSAGEKQLLTIARAFLSDPGLLILDEATSAVDTRTEVLVQEAMSALRADRTSFVIAHRLSTIRDADLILVMEAGRIVEQGSHAELLAAGGAFARLHQAQFEGAEI